MSKTPVEIGKALAKAAKEKVTSKTCIFTNRYCRYANNVDHGFDCQAPSDESMPCNK